MNIRKAIRIKTPKDEGYIISDDDGGAIYLTKYSMLELMYLIFETLAIRKWEK